MKRQLVLVLLFALSLPLSALAMSNEHGGHGGGKAMDHGKMEKMEHGNMIMVGDVTVDGVKGSAHLNDVAAEMKKAGQNFTHHFMVVFVDQKSGKQITEGAAALKVTGPDGKTAEPVKLIGMDGHFGADLVLAQKGEYTYEVGSKLPDGKKRTFEFKHILK